MTLPGLDAWITGNYGQDQFPVKCPICGCRLYETADGPVCPECEWPELEDYGERQERLEGIECLKR